MPLGEDQKVTFFSTVLPNESGGFDPHFARQEKVNGEWQSVEESREYFGRMIDAKLDPVQTSRGDTFRLSLWFSDGQEKEKVDMLMNGIAKSLINTLSNQGKKAFGADWKLRLYRKNGYNNIYCEVNGKKADWKFGAEEVSAISRRQDRWVDMFNKYVKPYADEYRALNEDPFDAPIIPDTQEDDSPAGDGGDDLPF